MSGYIKREDAISIIRRRCKKYTTICVAAVTELQDLPPADAVEVVRCKDCVYREVKGEGMTHWFGCRIMENNDDDWYCSFGERK